MKYFKLEEFDSPDQPGSGKHMKKEFLQLLDKSRALAGIPFVVTSGFRTRDWNERVGGRVGSSHLAVCAADLSCTSSGARSQIVQALIKVGFNRIGIGKNFIHVDNDITKTPAIWLY